MRNAIQYQLANTERRLIDSEDDREELRLRFDWLTKKCQEGGLQFNPDDLPRIVRRNAPATASTPAPTAAPAATASGLAAADSSTPVDDISPYGPDTSQHHDDDTRLHD